MLWGLKSHTNLQMNSWNPSWISTLTELLVSLNWQPWVSLMSQLALQLDTEPGAPFSIAIELGVYLPLCAMVVGQPICTTDQSRALPCQGHWQNLSSIYLSK